MIAVASDTHLVADLLINFEDSTVSQLLVDNSEDIEIVKGTSAVTNRNKDYYG